MKKVLSLILATVIFFLAGCSVVSRQEDTQQEHQSYKDITGVTQEEIDAIEALKDRYGVFSYGHLVATESFKQADGSYAGFTIDVCKLLSDMFQVQFSPKVYDEWADLKNDIDNCITNFSGEFTQTAERMRTYEMTTPIAGRGLNVYNLTSAPEITTEANLNGMRVGFLSGAVTAELIMERYPESSFETVDVPSFSDAYEMLLSGEIDAFVIADVADTQFEKYDNIRSKGMFQFVYAPVTITTKDPELQPIISVINKYLNSGGMETMFRLYREGNNKYKEHKLSQSFTEEERAYLEDLKQRNAMVNVALQHDAYPASFYNSVEGRYDGAAYDILMEVSELTGIEFNPDCMPVEKPLSDILAKLKTDEISMMPQLLYSESRKDDYIWSGISYITTNYALLSKSNYPNLQPFQIYYANVGTVNKSAHEELFNRLFPGHERTIVYQTGDEGFDALERGEIDLLMLSETMLLVQTNYREKLGYKVNLTFSKNLDTLFGYNKDEVILRDIIDKSMAYIDIKSIEENWVSRAFDYQSKMLKDMLPFGIGTMAVLLAALFVVFIFYIKNRRLSKNLEETVKDRTHELERQTTTLSTIYNSIPDLVFCKDLNSIYTGCNPSYERYTGMKEAELIGKSDFQVYKSDAEIAKLYIEADKKVLNNQDIGAIEEVIPSFDGTHRYFETFKTPLIQNNEVIGMMGISRDITERKAAEAVLEKRLKQQRLMANLSQKFIIGGDLDEQITESLRLIGEFMGIAQILSYKLEDDEATLICQFEWINPKFELQTRIGSKLVIADSMLSIVRGLSDEQRFCLNSNNPAMKAAMAPYRVNFKNYITTPFFLNDKMYGVLDFSKEDDGSQWNESDISLATFTTSLLSGVFGRHFMETELITAKELAEQGSRSKSDFLSRMSHEIRTPLNAIIGMNNIATNTDDVVKMRNCHEKIDNASKHLLGIINDILDMSKIEADKFELSYNEFDFEKTLMNITNVINFRAEEKQQNLVVNIGKDVPSFIFSDELRLSQVITNLLSNAVKFTPENGTIVLNIKKIEDMEDEVKLQIEVVDDGIGISEEQQSRLFNSFEQADGSISRKFGGTGLGLAISKRIVELMDGSIWIESELSKGSKFIFTIRVKKGNETTRAKISPQINKDNIHILAVDDSEETRICFKYIMGAHGLPCDVAASGIEALEMVEKCKDRPYNIFFVDWQMPEMDGIDLTKRIKEITGDNSVVFMISIADWNTIEKEALLAGVKQFVPKPLFPSQLIDAVNECLGVESAKTEIGRDNENTFDFSEHTILIAEDVEINQEIIAAVLEETGISIDFADNGRIAVSMFQDNPNKYSLILMDIHMPEMDGYETTRIIRTIEQEQTGSVPIIAMTANVFKEDVENCLAVGMNDHVGKPVDSEDLFKKLRKYLR